MKATLTPSEVDIVWRFADFIKGKDSNSIRQDCLGVEIHKEDYNCPTRYGWVIEYVISPQELMTLGITHANALCFANIRILNYTNYARNIESKRGHYDAFQYDECTKHWHIAHSPSDITEEGIAELQKTFGLNDEQIKKLFT